MSSTTEPLATQARQARVNRDCDGEPLGISVAVSADELRALGVPVDRLDSVEYAVRDGELRLSEPSEVNGDTPR